MKMRLNRQQLPLYIIIGSLLLIAIIYLVQDNKISPMVLITLGWIIIISFLLWIGNRTITRLLNRSLPWARFLALRFFVQLLASLLFALICINASYFLFKFMFTHDPPSPDQVFLVNMYSIFLVLPSFSIYYVVFFIREWKKSKLESELLQKENMQSQLSSLKNHLDPHFLFNNLNILSSLLEKGESASQDYLNKFAEVYRYMLQNKSMELIPLRQELEFIDSYMHLIQMRFKEALSFSVDIPEEKMECTLPPLTLQMLIENVVKHNALDENSPLQITIDSQSEDYLRIQNNIISKKVSFPSNGSGLENIKSRYKFYTDQQVIIENNGINFTVKVPLIEVEEL